MELSDNNKCSRAYLLYLEDRYSIERTLLGKRISVHTSENYQLSIVFPSLVHEGHDVKLRIPGLFKKYEIYKSSWGTVNDFSFNEPDKADVWISAVLVECHGNELNMMPSALDIQKIGKKIIHIIQIINPDAIRIPSEDCPNKLCKVTISAELEKSRKPQVSKVIASVVDDSTGALSFEDIKKSIQNAYGIVYLPYELVDNARINLSRHETREAVLNCATAIEVILKKKLTTYFDSTTVSDSFKEYLVKKFDGFNKLALLCNKCSISLDDLPDVKKTIVDIRNRVIHGGYMPSFEEAYKAYKDAKIALTALNVQMFE